MFKPVVAVIFAAACVLAGAAAAQSDGPTLARIKAAKAINVAYSADSPPFSFLPAGGAPSGYSIALCQRIIAAVGQAVGEPNLKINWLPASVSERLQMVAGGRADIECANTTQTQSRLGSVDFSNLIFVDAGGVLVKAGAPINAAADLAGKTIVVLKGSTMQTRLAEVLRKGQITATVKPVDSAAEGLAMLESDAADAFAGDKIKLTALALMTKEPDRMALLLADLSYEPYALALPRNDSAFRLVVNKALTQVYLSPDIETIYAQWLGPLGRPNDLLAMMFLLNVIPE